MEKLTRCVLKLEFVMTLIAHPDTTLPQFLKVKASVCSLIDHLLLQEELREFEFLVPLLVMRLRQINDMLFSRTRIFVKLL
jgi:hypothetical protein